MPRGPVGNFRLPEWANGPREAVKAVNPARVSRLLTSLQGSVERESRFLHFCNERTGLDQSFQLWHCWRFGPGNSCVSCAVYCRRCIVAAFLFRYQSQAPHPKLWYPKMFRHCSVSPRGHNRPPMKTTGLDEWFINTGHQTWSFCR